MCRKWMESFRCTSAIEWSLWRQFCVRKKTRRFYRQFIFTDSDKKKKIPLEVFCILIENFFILRFYCHTYNAEDLMVTMNVQKVCDIL